jgi:membrane protein DedA with SNARE-associated domain
VIDWILGQPYLVAAAFLTCVVAFRSQGTYWLGRGVRAGVVKTKRAEKLAGERAQKATRALERWGWPIIPLSFLTVGFQTAVNFTAGLIGWRWGRYTLAAVPGWLLWGNLYAAGGLAAFAGLGALARRSPWAAAGVIGAVVGGVILTVWLVRRARAAKAAVIPVSPLTPVAPAGADTPLAD